MRAKFINEIKQETEGSGLGSIGVGQSSVLKSYIKLNKRWPEWFNEDAKKLSQVFLEAENLSKSEKTKKKLEYYKEVFEEYSDNALENFICVNISAHGDPNTRFTETDELSFDMGFNFDDAYEMFNDEHDNGRKVIFSSKLEYLRRSNVGMIYLNICETHDNIFHYVFVKYK